jgi:GxxExxY protein
MTTERPMDHPQMKQMATDEVSLESEATRSRARTHEIIGAAMEVHNQLGHGFTEIVYHHALAVEFGLRGISFIAEHDLPVFYKDKPLPCVYRADFLCYSSVIVELKALSRTGPLELAQVMNYLKATGLARELLLNFGRERLEFRRVLLAPNLPAGGTGT